MKRSGYTLIEVLFATTVLALGLAAIFGLTRSALRKSADAADLADVQLACQTELNELIARQTPIRPSGPKAIEGLTDWKMAIAVYPSSKPELYTIHLSAQKISSYDSVPYGTLFELLRWVPEHRVEKPKSDEVIEEIDGFSDPFQ